MDKLKSITSALGLAGWMVTGWAADVHVTVCTEIAGNVLTIQTAVVSTGTSYTTMAAPDISGYTLVNWSLSTVQPFDPRDDWGRIRDAAVFIPYEDTVVTAHYLSNDIDEDQDGVADAEELKWYGNLSVTPHSDTDGDGWTLAYELAMGLNPLFPDQEIIPPQHGMTSGQLYNPMGYHKLTVRSQPENSLFPAFSEYIEPGKAIVLHDDYKKVLGNFFQKDETTSNFSYWTTNGVPVRDEWGRAQAFFKFIMPKVDVELVAIAIEDEMTRKLMHWFGTTEVDLTADADGDGLNTAYELTMNLNPLFYDTLFGGIAEANGNSALILGDGVHKCIIRSEPVGMLCSTQTNYMEVGSSITTTAYSPNTSMFAYWTANGVRVADEWGRARECVVTNMPNETLELVAVAATNAVDRQKLYWYGTTEVSLDSDTDGDGSNLALELAMGANPLFPDEGMVAGLQSYGGVAHASGRSQEMNLQPYDQGSGTLMGGLYSPFFASTITGAGGINFGENVCPAVMDWDGDGKQDLIVAFKGGIRVYLNRGTSGTPDLAETTPSTKLIDAFRSLSRPIIAGGNGVLSFCENGGMLSQYDPATDVLTSLEQVQGLPATFDRSDWARWNASFSAKNLSHRWSFNGDVADAIGGSEASVVGSVTKGASTVQLQGGARGTSYIDLGANLFPTNGVGITVEMWVTPDSVQNWSRIIDIGNSTADYLCWAWTCGRTDDSCFSVKGAMGDRTGLGAWKLGEEFHLAIVLAPEGDGSWRATCYKQNGTTGETLGRIVYDMAGYAWSPATMGQNHCWLGHSQFNGDNDASATYNEVRIWSRAMTENELTESARRGPDAEFVDYDASSLIADPVLCTLTKENELTEVLDGTKLQLDPPMLQAQSISFGQNDEDTLTDLLASDAAGRIWCYRRLGEKQFVLQNKVWGGTFEGFAEGLTVCAVDWDDDGDLDALCGTCDGRLILLRNPACGRPSNLTLAAGADSVSLKWDPLAQSKIRGYYVYRSEHGANAFAKLKQTATPAYLDKVDQIRNYDYQVTSVSRYYRAGNSKPTTVESAPTDVVNAMLGTVAFSWRPAAGFAGENVTVDLSVENARHLSADNLQLQVKYDPAVLVPVEIKKSGLTEKLNLVETRGAGSWLVTGKGGSIGSGAGTFLSFVFAVADQTAVADTKVTIEEFEIRSTGNRNVVPAFFSTSGSLELSDERPVDPAQVVPGSLGDLDGDGRLGWNDVELFITWKDRPTSEIPEGVRSAGDFNSDGVMDSKDYLLLKRFYRARETLGANIQGWDTNHAAQRGGVEGRQGEQERK